MDKQNAELPIVLGITGASGFIYGFRMLQFLLGNGYKVDLVLSRNSFQVAKYELDVEIDGSSPEATKASFLKYITCDAENLKVWDQSDIAASVSSGSYKTQGMIVAPCSMGTLANIAGGTSNNLVARAADVVIKEKRQLILVARETPLSAIHLGNMHKLSQLGVTILPAAPGFYHNPKTIDDQINFIVGKTLDVFGLDHEMFKRWVKEEAELTVSYS